MGIRNSRIIIRVSEEEKRLFQSKAESLRIPLSEFLRMLASNKSLNRLANRDLVSNLYRTGSKINGIAFRLSANPKALSLYRDLFNEIKEHSLLLNKVLKAVDDLE